MVPDRRAGEKEEYSLNNNNRNNNNRRRGRGNRGPGGGGNQQNRIDSRARGNAPQLLDKYKKLAQDAAHNGDRVQAEYFLQFADHYFRVIADSRSRQEDTRPRRDEREQDDFGDDEDGGEDRARSSQGQNRRPRGRRDEADQFERGVEGVEAEADDNPFAREEREERDVREDRPERRPRRRANGRSSEPANESGDFDASALPPSLTAPALTESLASEDKPRLKPRRRRANDDEDAVEAVNS